MSEQKTPKFLGNAQSAPDTGEMLRQLFKRRRIYKSALARALNRRYETVLDYQKRGSIQTTVLWELCHALKHNFFLDMAAQLPGEYATDAPVDGAKDARIAALERELEIVRAERDVVVRMGMGRG